MIGFAVVEGGSLKTVEDGEIDHSWSMGVFPLLFARRGILWYA